MRRRFPFRSKVIEPLVASFVRTNRSPLENPFDVIVLIVDALVQVVKDWLTVRIPVAAVTCDAEPKVIRLGLRSVTVIEDAVMVALQVRVNKKVELEEIVIVEEASRLVALMFFEVFCAVR